MGTRRVGQLGQTQGLWGAGTKGVGSSAGKIHWPKGLMTPCRVEMRTGGVNGCEVLIFSIQQTEP